MEVLYIATPRTGTRLLILIFENVENAYRWGRQMIAGLAGVEGCSG
jgi:hypothetical protein